MTTLQQKARKYFNDEMSGEPITQEAVEDALVAFVLDLVDKCSMPKINMMCRLHKEQLN